MCHELQIGPLQGWTQIAARRAGAAAAATGLLAPADAGTGAGRQVVDVLAVFEPELHPGIDDLGADQRAVHCGGVEISLSTMDLTGAFAPALGFLEEGQAVVPRPAAIAELGPVVVILGLAADINEPVDRAGSAGSSRVRPPRSGAPVCWGLRSAGWRERSRPSQRQ